MATEQSHTHRSGSRRVLFSFGSVAAAAYLAFFTFAVVRACNPQDITISFDCIVHHSNGTNTAYFNYNNTWTGTVPVPVAGLNASIPNVLTDTMKNTISINGSQPVSFKGSNNQHSFPFAIGIDF